MRVYTHTCYVKPTSGSPLTEGWCLARSNARLACMCCSRVMPPLAPAAAAAVCRGWFVGWFELYLYVSEQGGLPPTDACVPPATPTSSSRARSRTTGSSRRLGRHIESTMVMTVVRASSVWFGGVGACVKGLGGVNRNIKKGRCVGERCARRGWIEIERSRSRRPGVGSVYHHTIPTRQARRDEDARFSLCN